MLTLPKLDSRFRAWLLDSYHTRVYSKTGQAPSDRWTAGDFLPRLPESQEQQVQLAATIRSDM